MLTKKTARARARKHEDCCYDYQRFIRIHERNLSRIVGRVVKRLRVLLFKRLDSAREKQESKFCQKHLRREYVMIIALNSFSLAIRSDIS